MESSTAAFFPVGLRFRPTDSELLGHYLRRRVAEGSSYFDPYFFVKDRDLYGETEPWLIWNEELSWPGIEKKGNEELPDLYFFTKLKKKSVRGSRIDRRVGSGCWNAEDAGAAVKDPRDCQTALGLKKRFRYEGGPPEQEGRWIMLEYTLDPFLLPNSQPNNLVLCVLRCNRRIASTSSKKRKAAEVPEIREALPSKKSLKSSKKIAIPLEPQEVLSAVVSEEPSSVDVEVPEIREALLSKKSLKSSKKIAIPLEPQEVLSAVVSEEPCSVDVEVPEIREALLSKKSLKASKKIVIPLEPQEVLSAVVSEEPCSVDVEAQVQSTDVGADNQLGFLVPCPASKSEHHYQMLLQGSELNVQEPGAVNVQTQMPVLPPSVDFEAQVQSTVVDADNPLGFLVPCPASKTEHHDQMLLQGCELPGQDTLTTDDYWAELCLGETGMFDPDSWVELDDLLCDPNTLEINS